jgi:hypothetical protein
MKCSNKMDTRAATLYMADQQKVQAYRTNGISANILNIFNLDIADCPFKKLVEFCGSF